MAQLIPCGQDTRLFINGVEMVLLEQLPLKKTKEELAREQFARDVAARAFKLMRRPRSGWLPFRHPPGVRISRAVRP